MTVPLFAAEVVIPVKFVGPGDDELSSTWPGDAVRGVVSGLFVSSSHALVAVFGVSVEVPALPEGDVVGLIFGVDFVAVEGGGAAHGIAHGVVANVEFDAIGCHGEAFVGLVFVEIFVGS